MCRFRLEFFYWWPHFQKRTNYSNFHLLKHIFWMKNKAEIVTLFWGSGLRGSATFIGAHHATLHLRPKRLRSTCDRHLTGATCQIPADYWYTAICRTTNRIKCICMKNPSRIIRLKIRSFDGAIIFSAERESWYYYGQFFAEPSSTYKCLLLMLHCTWRWCSQGTNEDYFQQRRTLMRMYT